MANIINNDICRLCLCTDDTFLYPVDTRISWRNQDYPLAFRIIVCVGTDILPDDGLPQMVCHRCLYTIDAFFDFKENCEENEKLLIAGQILDVGGTQTQKQISSLYNFNVDDRISEVVSEMKQAPDDDNLHDSFPIYDSDNIIEEKLIKFTPTSGIAIEEATLTKESGEKNVNKEKDVIILDKNDKGVGNKVTNEKKQSSQNKKSSMNANGRNSTEALTEKSKMPDTNNELEATVCAIETDVSILPIERTDVSNSSEMLTKKSKMLTRNKKRKATVSLNDADVSVLPIERTERPNSSEKDANSKGNRKKRENVIRKSFSKEVTHVSSNDEQISNKRSKRIKLKEEAGQSMSYSAGGGNSKQKRSRLRTKDDKTTNLLEKDSNDSFHGRKMKSKFSSIINNCDISPSSNNVDSTIKSISSQFYAPIDIEDVIKKQRQQFKYKENVGKRSLEKKRANRQCTICDKIISSYDYVNHIESHKIAAKGDRKYTCIECNKSFAVKFSLTRHMLIHNHVKPFQCSKCKRSYSDRSNLLKHERSHDFEKPFGCPFCYMAFADSLSLSEHFNKTHKSNPDENNVQGAVALPLVDHECYTKKTKSYARFNQEPTKKITKSSSVEYEDIEDDEDDDLDYFEIFGSNYEDLVTGEGDAKEVQTSVKKMDDDDVIDMPIDDMNSNFWCRICPMCFPTLQELEAHCEIHKEVINITCNICDKEFDTTDNLKDHYKLHFTLRARKED